MLTPEQVQGLNVAFERLAEPVTEYLVRDVARRVAEAGQFTSTAAYEIWRAQELGTSRGEIEREVSRILSREIPEVQALFVQAAEVGYDFDIGHLPREAVPFAENAAVQQIVSAAVKLAEEDLRNITQTLGFQTPDGRAAPLMQAYQAATDEAFLLTSTGAADYNTAVRRACARLAAAGVRQIDYQSGVSTSLEAAIRRNMMGGLGLMVEQISQKNHDDLGADGWEISAHAASAPDHEPIQGRQYPDAEYQRLNGSLRRRIGTLNCGHNAFPILLGVNAPQHTAQELEKFRRDNEKGVDYEGRHFATVYEATQAQRGIERAIRAQKRRLLVDEEAGDAERRTQDQIRLRRLNAEYRRFSKAAGLRTEEERLMVSGFGNKQARAAEAAQKGFADFSASLAGVRSSTGVVVGEVSPHAYAQANIRGVDKPSVREALTAPLKVGTIREDMSQQFIGEHATVVINVNSGKIITLWPTHTKTAKKWKGGNPV